MKSTFAAPHTTRMENHVQNVKSRVEILNQPPTQAAVRMTVSFQLTSPASPRSLLPFFFQFKLLIKFSQAGVFSGPPFSPRIFISNHLILDTRHLHWETLVSFWEVASSISKLTVQDELMKNLELVEQKSYRARNRSDILLLQFPSHLKHINTVFCSSFKISGSSASSIISKHYPLFFYLLLILHLLQEVCYRHNKPDLIYSSFQGFSKKQLCYRG